MKINRDELLKALDSVSGGIATTAVLPEMLNINYSGDTGLLVTYNGPIMLSEDFELGDDSFSVPAVKLMNTVKSMPTEFEMFIVDGNMEFEAKGKKSKTNFGLALYQQDNSILAAAGKAEEYLETVEFSSLPDNFLEGIKLCAFSAAKNTNLGTLSCLEIRDDHITSSDNLRISCYKMSAKMDSCLIPVQHCAEILQLSPVKYHLHATDNTLFFADEFGGLICVRTVVGAFPDYRSIAFDAKYDQAEDITLPDELISMVKSVGAINSDIVVAEQYVTITFDNNKISVETIHSTGWGTQTLELDYELDLKFAVAVSCPAFLEVVKHTPQIKLSTEDNRLVFGDNKFRHVLPLLQVT